jgi:hypothetical protein
MGRGFHLSVCLLFAIAIKIIGSGTLFLLVQVRREVRRAGIMGAQHTTHQGDTEMKYMLRYLRYALSTLAAVGFGIQLGN